MKSHSERTFIKQNSIAGLGIFVGLSAAASLLMGQNNQPIIDIHQHTYYVRQANR